MTFHDEEDPIQMSKGSMRSIGEPSVSSTGMNEASATGSSSFAREETRRVKRSRLIVSGMVFVAAAIVGSLTFVFSRREEYEDFELQFHDYAVEIVDLAVLEVHNALAAGRSLSVAATTFALEAGAEWPFVTIPDFELRGYHNNLLSKGIQVSVVPLLTTPQQQADWERYSVEQQRWIDEGLQVFVEQDLSTEFTAHAVAEDGSITKNGEISPQIWEFSTPGDRDSTPVTSGSTSIPWPTPDDAENSVSWMSPVWQQSPAPVDTQITNYNILSHPDLRRVYHGMWATAETIFSEVLEDVSFLYEGSIKDDIEHPHTYIFKPIFRDFVKNDQYTSQDVVAALVIVLNFDQFFENLLPEGTNGIDAVLHNSCGQDFTYRLNGPTPEFVGLGDLHNRRYDDLEVAVVFTEQSQNAPVEQGEACVYDLHIYPSSTFKDAYITEKPAVYTAVVVAIFIFTALMFFLYDFLVTLRQESILAEAKRTNAIVTSLFPSNVRDRILQESVTERSMSSSARRSFGFGAKAQLKDFLHGDENGILDAASPFDTKPIADLFPAATVMFADIVGFTAWSSVREPTQVFSLLETVYHSFDEIARTRKVFKVETVGDCYVAVAGLPEARKDHAVVMARFSRDCLYRMNDLTKRLEVTLGPDTGDLSMRIGLHSGPVTAGVLRGDKSRFQLFGDTVNTASKIESSGSRNRIHISSETAKLLMDAGKEHWLRKREDIVRTKVKGDMVTYWLEFKAPSYVPNKSESGSNPTDSDDVPAAEAAPTKTPVAAPTKAVSARPKRSTVPKEIKPSAEEEKERRLVEWNADVLARLLRQIVAHREAVRSTRGARPASTSQLVGHKATKRGGTVIDEVKEIIELPEFDATAAKQQQSADTIKLDDKVMTQLKDFVAVVASLYRANPFHNFEHASHVTMSVVKLLSRIIAPDLEVEGEDNDINHAVAATLHDHTYGITSDPLTQFACVFAALIHDVDHTGVPNTQLVKEGVKIAKLYKGKSVAEQNSVDMAWQLLMHSNYKELRAVICETNDELRHFRELVVNSVMATDIVDKELKALRNARWEKAFSEENQVKTRENINRKATIVIEHLIQASDIAHTMQHWHIYRKWNERLFHELYAAYRNGRSEKDPSEFWAKGEIGFFDFYIIPLAKKLKDCGVFGVSSDEYLNYAQKNRAEWETQGQQVVEKMVEKYQAEYAHLGVPSLAPTPPPEEAKLDAIQDYEKSPLRSRMFRSDTLSDSEGFFFDETKDDEEGIEVESLDSEGESEEDLVSRATARLAQKRSKK